MTAGDEAQVRALRLRALREAPHAFGSSLELEDAHPDTHWSELVEHSAAAEEGALFVAVERERWIAMAGARWFNRSEGIAQLWGMWVDPGARGRGLGRALVEEVAAWARARGAVCLRLGVTEDAPEAARFYERLGFMRTGERKALVRDRGEGCAFFLVRRL